MKKTKKSRRIRKAITAVIVLALVGVIAAIQFVPTPISASVSIFGKQQKQIAHRGLSSVCPECSEDAYIAAGEAGYFGAECDVYTTKDGKLVIMHDEDVDRTTDGEGKIGDLTFEEVQQLHLDTGNGIENCKNTSVLTIGEFLAVCREYNMVPVIELKKLDTAYLPDLFEEIEKYGLTENAILISFTMDYLIECRAIDRSMKMLFLSNKLKKEQVDECINYGFGVNFDFAKLYKYFGAVNYAAENGVELAAWTVDFPIAADFLHLIGCDYITSNRITP